MFLIVMSLRHKDVSTQTEHLFLFKVLKAYKEWFFIHKNSTNSPVIYPTVVTFRFFLEKCIWEISCFCSSLWWWSWSQRCLMTWHFTCLLCICNCRNKSQPLIKTPFFSFLSVVCDLFLNVFKYTKRNISQPSIKKVFQLFIYETYMIC